MQTGRNDMIRKMNAGVKENTRIFAAVLILFVLSRMLLTFAACAYNYAAGTYTKTWDLLYKFDALWYVDIVENGYQSVPNSVTGYANYAFYPFYPIVVRVAKGLLPDRFTTNQVGIMVSNLCTLIAGFVGVKAVRAKYSEDTGYFMAFLIFFAPHTLYFSMTYTEAMFMMFTICFFYFCGQRKFLPAAIAAFFAAFTRIAGVFLVFSLLLYMYEADYGWKFGWRNIADFIRQIFLCPLRLFEILICPLGIFGYFYYLYRLTGDVWASAHIQVAWHNSYEGILRTLFYNLLDSGSGTSSQYWALYAVFWIGMFVYLCWRKQFAAAVFGILAVGISLRTDAIAISRYIMGNFATYIALYELLRGRETVRMVVMNVCIIVSGLMYYMWFAGECYFIF